MWLIFDIKTIFIDTWIFFLSIVFYRFLTYFKLYRLLACSVLLIDNFLKNFNAIRTRWLIMKSIKIKLLQDIIRYLINGDTLSTLLGWMKRYFCFRNCDNVICKPFLMSTIIILIVLHYKRNPTLFRLRDVVWCPSNVREISIVLLSMYVD